MRLLPISLLLTVFSSVAISETPEKPLGGTTDAKKLPALKAEATKEEDAEVLLPPTIFNGVEVPPIPEIDGTKFDATVKDGYWFVKHHS